jgi:hypothetical protein
MRLVAYLSLNDLEADLDSLVLEGSCGLELAVLITTFITVE